jgi:hypothetical protein
MLVALRPEARNAFRLLCNLSLWCGAIAPPTWYRRRAYLRELQSDDRKGNAHMVAEPERPTDADVSPEPAGSMKAHPDLAPRSGVANDEDDWLEFIPAGPIGHLKAWRFIVGDPDPHPSVPHGHEHGRAFPKLDPYLGWVYAAPNQTSRRLSKDDTRALWNDQRFRDFAAAALLHFSQANTVGFPRRVANPFRLPRRRP